MAKTALIKRNIIPEIIGMIEKKKANPIIAQSGLKLVENIAKSKEGLEYLKQNDTAMQAIVQIMDAHPNDSSVLNIGSNVLGSLATVQDLNSALADLRSGNL